MDFRGELTSGWDWGFLLMYSMKTYQTDVQFITYIKCHSHGRVATSQVPYNPSNGGGYLGSLNSDGDPTAWGDWTQVPQKASWILLELMSSEINGRTLQTFDFKLFKT